MLLLFLTLACASAPKPASAAVGPPSPAPLETPAPAAVPLRPGDRDAGITGRCADGQVVLPSWTGQPPTPVLQLDVPATARVARDPCGPVTHACDLVPGLFHPSASDAQASPSVTGFAVRTRVEPDEIVETGASVASRAPSTQMFEVRCAGEDRPYWLPVDAGFASLAGVREERVIGDGEVAPSSDGPVSDAP